MITPLQRYHAKIFVFSGIFIFKFLLLQIDNLGCINALYIESSENFYILM
jgi:hypothetical protein